MTSLTPSNNNRLPETTPELATLLQRSVLPLWTNKTTRMSRADVGRANPTARRRRIRIIIAIVLMAASLFLVFVSAFLLRSLPAIRPAARRVVVTSVVIKACQPSERTAGPSFTCPSSGWRRRGGCGSCVLSGPREGEWCPFKNAFVGMTFDRRGSTER